MIHRGGHFIEQDISTFDAAFFGIPHSEAHATDLQQRIQLDVAYEASKNADVHWRKPEALVSRSILLYSAETIIEWFQGYE